MEKYFMTSLLPAGIIIFVFLFLLYRNVHDLLKYHKALKAGQDGKEKRGYIRTTGHFTGQVRDIPARIRAGYIGNPRKEFEIEYPVDGESYTAWYTFYPVDPPDDEDALAGVRVAVSYDEKKPWIFILDEIFWDIV